MATDLNSESMKSKDVQSILSKADMDDIDAEVINLVFGYIRRYEVSSDSNIPFGITMICLSYYYLNINEYFAYANSSFYEVVHTEDSNTVEVLGNYDKSSVYGNVLIPSARGGIYIWTFQMLKRETSMFFGITSEHENTDGLFYRKLTGHNFALSTTGSLSMHTSSKETKETTGCESGPRTCKKEIFKMKLNLNNRTLRYEYVRSDWNAEKDFGFDNIPCGMDINYKMAIRFLNKGSKVALLHFCIE